MSNKSYCYLKYLKYDETNIHYKAAAQCDHNNLVVHDNCILNDNTDQISNCIADNDNDYIDVDINTYMHNFNKYNIYFIL